jgi:hypothetical protein
MRQPRKEISMLRRMLCLAALVGVVALVTNRVCAMRPILGETKDQLKLKYDVSIRDLGNGRVWIIFTLADEGRLKPIRSVDLQIPGKDPDANGGVAPDLALSLAMSSAKDGGTMTQFELSKEFCERAEIWLQAPKLDGNLIMDSGGIHRIPLADYLKNAAPPPPRGEPATVAPPAPAAPPASEIKR